MQRQPMQRQRYYTNWKDFVPLMSQDAGLQVRWLKLLLGEDIGVSPLKVKLHCDNQSTVAIAHNPTASDRS
jgi:hypothetical protein